MSDVSALERTGQFTIRSGKEGKKEVVRRPLVIIKINGEEQKEERVARK